MTKHRLIGTATWGILAALLFCSNGCLGYHVGNQSLFPNDISTIYVPVFESDSYRPDLGERMTEAVIKQIEQTTPYKVVGSPGKADCILVGRVTGDSKRVESVNIYDVPQQLGTSMGVAVSLIDRQSGRTVACDTVPLPPEVVGVTGDASFVPAIGQSVVTSQQVAIQRMAQQIVTMMESPW